MKVSSDSLPGFETYFEREESNYQYSPLLASFYGEVVVNFLSGGWQGYLAKIVAISDYEHFHRRKGSREGINALCLDMHVGDLMQWML